jgi:hypothetical protein
MPARVGCATPIWRPAAAQNIIARQTVDATRASQPLRALARACARITHGVERLIAPLFGLPGASPLEGIEQLGELAAKR